MVVRALRIVRVLVAAVAAAVAVASCGCSRLATEPPIVIAGATLIDGTSAPPIADSVFVITGDKISAMGDSATTLIPAAVTRFDGKGRFIFSTDPAQPLRIGAPATFLLLSVNPALDPDYDKKVVGSMQDGRWIQFPQ